MQKKFIGVIAAAILLAATPSLFASISLQVTYDFNINPTLAAAGWYGVKLTLVPDGTITKNIAGFDFSSPLFGVNYLANTPIGIYGPMHQAWTLVAGDPLGASSPSNNASKIPTNPASRVDSFFITPATFRQGDGFGEDNNAVLSSASAPFMSSPLADIPVPPDFQMNGIDYGVGSYITGDGVLSTAVSSYDFAYLLIPAIGTFSYSTFSRTADQVTIYGAAFDSSDHAFAISSSISLIDPRLEGAQDYPPNLLLANNTEFLITNPAPEPATLSLLLPIAGFLLNRRRV